MSLALQSNLFNFSSSRLTLNFSSLTTSVVQKNPRFSLLIASRFLSDPIHFHIYSKQKLHCPFNFISFRSNPFSVKVFDSEGVAQREDDINLDSFLSVSEFLCLASSTFISIVFAVTRSIPNSKKAFSIVIGDRFIVWGIVLLVAGAALGALIRRRQWRRICGQTVKGALEVNLLERIEKLEEDLKSSATIVRVLSRQLEKLGIRFRVTRKALKEPIVETAALAQKNSEATRALAEQEDILEKELGEIQKVLLAMQEQQRKQLELIVAIGKSGKLLESRQEPNRTQISNENRGAADEALRQKEAQQI